LQYDCRYLPSGCIMRLKSWWVDAACIHNTAPDVGAS
jgi:hypothetical protein